MRSCFGPRVSSFDAEEGQAHCALLKAPCSFYKQRSPDARLGSLADIRERIRDVRLIPRSRHVHRWHQCPLSAISRQLFGLATARVKIPDLKANTHFRIRRI